jgi:hypothetical protein
MILWLAPGGGPAGGRDFTDPAGDDYGPGSFRYPEHPVFVKGVLDLRRLRLERVDSDWRVEVEFSAAIKTVGVFISRDERRRAFLQLVDIYFYLPKTGPVRTEALPGRRVNLRPGWQKAAVLCAFPELMRDALYRSGYDREEVFVPERVTTSGKKLRAVLPAEWLDEEPRALTVLVGAALADNSFRLKDRLDDSYLSRGLVMEVRSGPDECRLDDLQGMRCHFSGCRPCGNHPQIIDVLDMTGEQKLWLGGYNSRTRAVVEMVLLSAEGGE